MGFDLMHPWWLLLLLPAAYAMVWWYRGERRLLGTRKKAVAVLRSLMFLLLIFAVAGLTLQAPVDKQEVVFVVDESKSIFSQKQAVAFVQEAIRVKRPDDTFAILGTGERPAVEYPLSVEAPGALELGGVLNKNFTDLAAGLRLAQGLIDTGYQPRVVLLSDGEQNLGDAVREAGYLKERGIQVDVSYLKREVGAEVLVKNASVPATLYQGENFTLTAVVESTVATQATLQVFEDNRPIAKSELQVQKGESRLSIPLQATDSGFHRYRVEVLPAQDTEPVNNTSYAYGDVLGKSPALIVEGKPGDAKWLTEALRAGKFPYRSVTAATMPKTVEDLRRYSVVVLANVSGVEIPESVQRQIESAVRDFGVGLMMTGGDDSFGLGGYFDTPVEKALPVYMDLRNQQEIPSLGLILVIDRSGSMGTEKMELAKEAARRSTGMLKAQDTLGVLAFDTTNWWVVEPTKVTDPKALQDKISGIAASGGTSIYPAVEEAFYKLENLQTKRKHIILLTDGQSPEGDYDGLTARMKEKGITMSTVAVGQDADTALLESLAEKAKGRFYSAVDSQSVPMIFSKETALAGKTYIEDNPFTPGIGVSKELAPLFAKGLPQINAHIAVTEKETADVVLANPKGEPVLARWQYGLGRAAAWTSDAKGVWSNQWAAWSGSSAFWNQLMTWLLPQYQTDAFDMRAGITGGKGELSIRLQEPLAQGAVLKARVVSGDAVQEEVPLLLKAPGEYVGQFNADRPGTYLMSVVEEQSGNVLKAASSGIAVAYSPEYDLPKSGQETLAAIAQAGGGRVLNDPAVVFAGDLPPKWSARDLSYLLLLLAACLWPLDVALRRVSISTARLAAWQAARQKGKAERNERSREQQKAQSTSMQGLKRKAEGAAERRTGGLAPPPVTTKQPTAGTTTATPAPPPKQEESSTVSKLLDKKRKK
ncbi:VWA domain-containing protein [Tumebacillus sp. BK434]|uniref:VWA domain-containing protein n=1 Tax=Tumebacillus sp. BK434 TaxID=2512169 RepID=UPI0010458607|nr:VWA domain-containing protein [Tumebacillus sp. BK434]